MSENEISQLQVQIVPKIGVGGKDGCDGDVESDTPVLPPELEQQIFTMAFYNDEQMKDACCLLLIAKKTFEWLAPLFYEIVIFHSSTTWPPMKLSPDKLPRYGKYVRHLLLEYEDQEHATKYLEGCPNIVDLALVHQSSNPLKSEHLDALASLPVKELSMDIRPIPVTPQIIPLFRNITHLDLAYFSEWEEIPFDTLSHFTNITHLMMEGFEDCTNVHVNHVLERIPHLVVLVVVFYVWPYEDIIEGYEHERYETEFRPNHPRVVVVSCTFVPHWKAAARGLESPWSFADEVMAKRRGLVQSKE